MRRKPAKHPRATPKGVLSKASASTAAAERAPAEATVALVGRPNVGKSTLFNRLVGGRPALVEDEPGVTRDRRYGRVEWDGHAIRIVDTGGLDPSAEGILGAMRGQTLRAIEESAVLVLVVDGVLGTTGLDQEVAGYLRATGKPVLVAANKIDSAQRQAGAADAHRMGFPEVFPVSAAHGRGVGELLDAVLQHLDLAAGKPPVVSPEPAGDDDAGIRIALIGKPNAGKSSLINSLLGEDRVLVHDQPGTTRDPIDTHLQHRGQAFVLVDTAGLRRRRAVKTLTEAVSGKMARDQIARADVVGLVVDLSQGVSDEDARMTNLVEEEGRALVLVASKSDKVARTDLNRRVADIKEKLAFAAWAPEVVTSSHTGRGVTAILDAAQKAYEQWTRRIPTPRLNRDLETFVAHRAPPAGPAGRHVRLYYMTQPRVSPPTFFISTNLPTGIGEPYRRYLLNQIRKTHGFEGTPLRVLMRDKKKERSASSPTRGRSKKQPRQMNRKREAEDR